MSQKSRVVLKTKFEAGRTPTEDDFGDVIDSGINKLDDHITVRNVGEAVTTARYIGIGSFDPESPVSIRNRSEASNLLGFEDRDGNEKWQFEIDPEDADEGLNIKEVNTEHSNLFIKSGGHVGLGTRRPEEKLHVEGKIKADEFLGTVDWSKLSNIPFTLFVPRGAIIMWSGNENDIPTGWNLCDGNNGTPDLRGRFVVGISNTKPSNGNAHANDPDYLVPGNSGGEKAHKLSDSEIPKHTHDKGTLSISSGGGHGHSFNQGYRQATGSGGTWFFSNHEPSASSWIPIGGGEHSHASSDFSGATGDGSATLKGLPHENRPPYYAIAFIMKS